MRRSLRSWRRCRRDLTIRPVTVRRGGKRRLARSVMGEFVSGNYFRTFGLKPQAGRLFTDADDVQGAPMVAVMSYETWQRDYAGDPAVVGSTFWVNTKAVTIAGIAPEGYFGDRLSSTPPDFYLPIETMPVLANAAYVHDPNQNWLYMVGPREARRVAGSAAGEGERAGAADRSRTARFAEPNTMSEAACEGARGADAGRRRASRTCRKSMGRICTC